jgi:hypothetical protein
VSGARDVRVRWRSRLLSHDVQLSSLARLAGCALCEHADKVTGSCAPSVETIASRMGASCQSARRAMKELETGGLLTVERQSGLPSVYTIQLPPLPESHPYHTGTPTKTPSSQAPEQEGQEDASHLRAQRASSSNGAAAGHGDELPSAQELVAFFVDESRRQGAVPTPRLVGHVAREVKQLLEQRADVEHVRAALAIVVDKALHPSALPSAVYQAQRATARRGGTDAAFAHLDF